MACAAGQRPLPQGELQQLLLAQAAEELESAQEEVVVVPFPVLEVETPEQARARARVQILARVKVRAKVWAEEPQSLRQW